MHLSTSPPNSTRNLSLAKSLLGSLRSLTQLRYLVARCGTRLGLWAPMCPSHRSSGKVVGSSTIGHKANVRMRANEDPHDPQVEPSRYKIDPLSIQTIPTELRYILPMIQSNENESVRIYKKKNPRYDGTTIIMEHKVIHKERGDMHRKARSMVLCLVLILFCNARNGIPHISRLDLLRVDPGCDDLPYRSIQRCWTATYEKRGRSRIRTPRKGEQIARSNHSQATTIGPLAISTSPWSNLSNIGRPGQAYSAIASTSSNSSPLN